MSETIYQIFQANPTTSAASTDLIYLGKSPYNASDDSAISFANLVASISLPLTSITGFGSGIATFLATPSSANLATAVTDETGTGALVFATNPVLVTPNLGVPSTLTLTNATGLPVPGGLGATGTPTSSTYLDGSGAWSVPPGSGTVNVGVAGQLAYYDANGDTVSGSSLLSQSGSTLSIGSSGTQGIVTLYPPTASSGFLQLSPQDNSAGNFNTILTNAASVAQTQTLTYPDCGASTANVILSKSAGTQLISSGNLQVGAGYILAGSASGVAGYFATFPNVASSGQLSLQAITNAAGDFHTVIQNASSVAQTQTVTIPDSGASAVNFLLSKSAGTQTVATGNIALSAGKISAVNMVGGFTSTASSGGTLVLTATSNMIQEITGTMNHTVQMPDPSTMALGTPFIVINNSTGTVSINSSGSSPIQSMASNTQTDLILILTSGSGASSWQSSYLADTGLDGAVLLSPGGAQTIQNGYPLINTGLIQTLFGTVLVGSDSGGNVGQINIYPATNNAGSLRLVASDNTSGDFYTEITNSGGYDQNQIITIPDANAADANFLISKAEVSQQIETGSLEIVLGNLTISAGSLSLPLGDITLGSNGSGATNTLVLHPPTINSGSLTIQATNNVGGNHGTVITNFPSIGQAQVISVPDSGTNASTFILADSVSGQDIAGGLTLNSDPIATYGDSTFTPAIQFGGGSTGVTYTSRGGSYTRIGNVITFSIYMLLSSKGSSTGAVQLTGLPTASRSSSLAGYTFSVVINAGLALPAAVTGYNTAGQTTITLLSEVTTDAVALTDANITNTTEIIVSGSYLV